MTPHPNAEYLRALADGQRVLVEFADKISTYQTPLWDCSTTVIMSLLNPHSNTAQAKYWSFHIEQEDSHA